MGKEWDQNKIQDLIDNQVQESLSLEFKSAAALGKYDEQKTEIAKDVSAFANSAGGILIYGIKEYRAQDKKHLPEAIDPIDQSVFTKEWLENVINNIQPRIDGLKIYPVKLNSSQEHCVYVINIPQSHTAHQAIDRRYYKRYNFQNSPMDDYEIRDIMGREKNPKINLTFSFTKTFKPIQSFSLVSQPRIITSYELLVHGENVGNVYARYINYIIHIPAFFIHEFDRKFSKYTTINSKNYAILTGKNIVRDYMGSEGSPILSIEKYGPSRYEPLLPGLSCVIDSHLLADNFEDLKMANQKIYWKVHADNALPNSGDILLKNVKIQVDNPE